MNTKISQHSLTTFISTFGSYKRLSFAVTAALLGCSAAYAGAESQSNAAEGASNTSDSHQTVSFSGSGYIG